MKPTNIGLKLKDMKMSVDSNVIRKPLPKDKRKWPGLKPGSGGLPDGGMGASGPAAAEGLELACELLRLVEEAPALEDITSEQPVNSQGGERPSEPTDDAAASDDPLQGEESVGGEDATIRYVKGAHLIYKRQVETGQFEELWIYTVDPSDNGSTPLKAILAGTDIPENKAQSDDGTQSYTIWTAGNAQYAHIKGLSN